MKKVHADSELMFYDTLHDVSNIIQAQIIRNGQLEIDLKEFISKHETHASF